MKNKFDEAKLLGDKTPVSNESLKQELEEMKNYCKLYARLYSELKLEFLQVKHFLKLDSLPNQFVNTNNGLTLPMANGCIHKNSHGDLGQKIEELQDEVKRLQLENSELKLLGEVQLRKRESDSFYDKEQGSSGCSSASGSSTTKMCVVQSENTSSNEKTDLC